ncbi:MAG: PAS domain-containing sensor histidine kinase, partial [Leptospira sp.]|nr:PAS domain-containing sensor histidine kinase [Leptospira sp.]
DLLSDLTEKDINSFLREINFAEYYPDYSLNDLKNFIFGSPSTANVFNYLPDTKLFEDLFDIVQSGDSFHPDRNINLRIISEWPQVKRDSSKGEEIRTGQSAIKLKTESRIDKNPEFRRRPGAVYRKFLNDVDSLLLDFMEGKYQSRLTIGDIVTYDTPARKILNHALDHFYNVFQLLQYQINRLENLNSILEIKIDRGSVDLQFSEEKYRYLFEYSTEALVIVDVVSGRIIDSNNKFRHFTGFSRTDINQMTIYDLIAGENKLPDLASSFDRSEFAIYLSDYEMVRKDRVMLSVDLNINSHILSATRKYQIQFIDNSEKKEAERLKHEFISNISHELRSPMTNIQGYFQLVASKKEIKANPELRDMMRVIEKNIKRLNLLIDNLLKLESRGIAVASDELEKFSPAQMIEEVLQTNMQLAEDKGLEVIQNLDHSLVIEGIKFEFTQVLTNLFINAVKYTKKGSITVTLEKEKTRSNIAIIKFTDTGIGIDPKYNIAVFERFFRAPGPENRKIGGTGLGLSITQSLLEKIGGVVLLDSTPGVGSTFTINLPLSRE